MNDNQWEDDDVKYLGNGKYILKPFPNIWFNPDGSEISPLDKKPLPPDKIGDYICHQCKIRTDLIKCPICGKYPLNRKVGW